MLPQEFLQRMEKLLGEEYPEFLKSYEQEKYQSLRINTLKRNESGEDPKKVLEALFHLEKIPWAEQGFYYPKEDQPGKHPLHEAGAYYIQEPSAMAPVGLLEVKPGEKILDLCAAPGGKSTQIAAALEGQGLLVSNEIHPQRAKILSENLERLGVVNSLVTNESPEKLSKVFVEFFDKILVDAPCSGEGMFRKNEDACEEWSPENVELCAERQAGILEEAAVMLRPGGRLVYSTCTFAPAENEGSIRSFLEKHPEFTLLPIDLSLYYPDGSDFAETSDWKECKLTGTLRLYPHRLKGEGHFAAVLKKAGEVVEGYDSVALSGRNKPMSEKELVDVRAFERENFPMPLQELLEKKTGRGGFHYMKFGEQIYLLPEKMPGIAGLKVLRPGLHVGTLKKSRFEPSHALALALSPAEVRYSYCLDSKEKEASDYINGQTFPAEGEKGWYLICVDGFSTGWGKLAGGIMKNHYPKGLRK